MSLFHRYDDESTSLKPKVPTGLGTVLSTDLRVLLCPEEDGSSQHTRGRVRTQKDSKDPTSLLQTPRRERVDEDWGTYPFF